MEGSERGLSDAALFLLALGCLLLRLHLQAEILLALRCGERLLVALSDESWFEGAALELSLLSGELGLI